MALPLSLCSGCPVSSLMAVIRLWTQAESERQAADPRAAHSPAPALPDTAAARAYIIERKKCDTAPHEASALYPPQVTAVIDAMRPASRGFLRDRALILLGFALGRRSEQIVGIDLEDLQESPDGRALRVWLPARGDGRRTGRRERVTVPAANDPRYCPVRAVRQWHAALRERGYDRGPLFPRLDRLGGIGAAAMTAARRRSHDDGRLLPYTVALILRRHAAAAGLSGPAADPARKISTHSLRRGFVVSAFARGADPVSVARHAGFADTSRSMAGYVKPGTGWDRNPAAGVFDQPTAVPPAEPVDAAAENPLVCEGRAAGGARAWVQPALWSQVQTEP